MINIKGKIPYMSQVNLDALIPREDLEIKELKHLHQSRQLPFLLQV